VDGNGKPRAAATIRAETARQWDLVRYARLAQGVEKWIEKMCRDYSIDKLLIGIEYPIVKGRAGKVNVANYRKQASTVAAIELRLAFAGFDALVEVNPTEAKIAATGHGDATKAEIIVASPLAGSGPSVEAMADAWAIAMAARDNVGNAMPLDIVQTWRPYETYTEELL